MSSNLPYKQAANVERRTWDKETYEARAKARRKLEAEHASGTSATATRYTNTINENTSSALDILTKSNEPEKEEFQSAAAGAQGPLKSKRAYLKARQSRVDIDSKVGTTEIINPDAAAKSCAAVTDGISITDGVTKMSSAGGVGWHCKVCDCFLKDSLTYLDHINGRKHQRALGYSMRISKSTTNEVVNKLNVLAAVKQKRLEEEEQEVQTIVDNNEDDADINEYDEIVRKKDEEEKRRKADRKRRREERKKKVQQEKEKQESNNDEEEEDGDDRGDGGGVNPDIAAMMGFSGFS